jgi:hypothetical protein
MPTTANSGFSAIFRGVLEVASIKTGRQAIFGSVRQAYSFLFRIEIDYRRYYGETVANLCAVNEFHWFAGNFLRYGAEWEVVEYCRDMVAVSDRKDLILLGEVKSVEGGMKYCADWLDTVIGDVPVNFISIIEPYWAPDEPLLEINTRI